MTQEADEIDSILARHGLDTFNIPAVIRIRIARVIEELETRQWKPVPNQFEYEGTRRSNPRWLTVLKVDNTGVSYLVLESPEDGITVAIELPPSLSLCQKVNP